MASLHELLHTMIERRASDLHITAGTPPQIRVDGGLQPLDLAPLSPSDAKQLVYSVLTDAQKHRFEEESDLDFSFGIKGLSRFRGNVFIQKGSVAAAIRTVPFEIKPFDALGLPPIINDLIKKPMGLVLVTGPTGSGKSTSLASMIDKINTEKHDHIVTVEDPIEFLHLHKKSIVNQREVTTDTKSFKMALRYILRQDPDVVLIGEMRDLETTEATLSIAETGHLTFATLHTNSAAQTINRIVDMFPPHQQGQIRAQLSSVLEGVISQQLIPHKSGIGRVMAVEVMVPNSAIRNLIREDKVHQIYSAMQTGQELYGMITMNQSLVTLYTKGLISYDVALARSSRPEELTTMLGRTGRGPGATPLLKEPPRMGRP
ncbi:MAG: type IV pilus twitching motility protein PilT [Nitrospirota bacterium]